MEESEKRRERLKAMRDEAAQSTDGVGGDLEFSGLPPPTALANPLVENINDSTTPNHNTAPRFDYYTDPMAAFSSNKRRIHNSPQVSPNLHYNAPPRHIYGDNASHAFQNPAVNLPGQMMSQAPGVHYNRGPPGNLMEAPRPLGFTRGYPPGPGCGSPAYQNPGQMISRAPGVHYNCGPPGNLMEAPRPLGFTQGYPPGPGGGSPAYQNPGQMISRAPGVHYTRGPPGHMMEAPRPLGFIQGNPPGQGGGSSGSWNNVHPTNLSRDSNFSNTGKGGSSFVHYGHGRGQRYNNSSNYGSGSEKGSYHNSGRGGGQSPRNRASPGSGTSGSRVSSGNPVSPEVKAYLYYNKEMVEDPWKMLEPVVWKKLDIPDSEKSWLPTSIRTKKAKVPSGETSVRPIGKQSLAELLAASFNDSVDKDIGNESNP